jgi:cytidine deaminase
MKKEMESLLEKAKQAALNAYAPYSGYKVGAALITDRGTLFTGCNVENSSYSLTNCAERTAIFKMVSAGESKIKMIAVYVDAEKLFSPCGACRQVIHEFGSNVEIVYASRSDTKITTIEKLLPESFSLNE